MAHRIRIRGSGEERAPVTEDTPPANTPEEQDITAEEIDKVMYFHGKRLRYDDLAYQLIRMKSEVDKLNCRVAAKDAEIQNMLARIRSEEALVGGYEGTIPSLRRSLKITTRIMVGQACAIIFMILADVYGS